MASSLFGPAISNPQNRIGTNPVQSVPSEFQPSVGFNRIKSMMNLMKSGGNLQAMVQNMLLTSPQGSSVMNLISQHGGDARAAFYDLAKQKNVDPNQILNMLQ